MTGARGQTPAEPVSKSEHARRLAKQGFDELAEALDGGDSARLTAFLSAMARFHSYSFGNVMLILSQRPEATRVAGFHTWRSLGRQVRKGERGITILAPMKLRRANKKEDDDDGTPGTVLRFRATHVFDIAQTDGEPLPELGRVSGDVSAAMKRLTEFVAQQGIELAYRDDLGMAEGVSLGGRIHLRSGLAPADAFSVLTHEMAHELLHRVPEEDRPDKVVRETEAEAVAHVVGSAVGLESNGAAADYIRLYRGDRETLTASLDRIQKTATRIIAAVLPEERSKVEVARRVPTRERSR